MIKVIFSDMDGTLLDENSQLPKEFDQVIAELKKRGVIFAPASGRQYFALLKQMGKYKDDFMFLAENGAFSMYRDQEICSSPMPMEIIRRVIKRAEELEGVHLVLCGKKNAYVKADWQPYIGEADKYFTHSVFVEDYESIDDEFIKIALCDAPRADAEHFILPFVQDFSPELQVCLSGHMWVDLLNPGINKGWAIRQVQKKFGVGPEECAAFGDYMNDYEMMQAVYYSYAMANAHPGLSEVARFTCKSNKEHGVMEQIKEFIRLGLI